MGDWGKRACGAWCGLSKCLKTKITPHTPAGFTGGWRSSARDSMFARTGSAVDECRQAGTLDSMLCGITAIIPGRAYDVGPVFGPWSSGSPAAPSASCRAFSLSTNLGEMIITLPGVWSSVIVGSKSLRRSSMTPGLYHPRAATAGRLLPRPPPRSIELPLC
jgi:hypothetical protein